MTDHWSPWIEHDGGECPASVRCYYVQALGETPRGRHKVVESWVIRGDGMSWDWTNFGAVNPDTNKRVGRILRYRIRRPRGMAVLDAIARGETAGWPSERKVGRAEA